MFGLFGGKGKNPEREAAKASTQAFNSLVEDQHVDKSNEEHMKYFNKVRAKVADLKIEDLRIRGLKVEHRLSDKQVLAKVEVLCGSEQAIAGWLKVMKEFKGRIDFSYVRIMGGDVDSVGPKVKVGQAGLESLIEGFTQGLFFMTYEFRFYNFDPEHTPLLAFVDSLINNPSLQTLGFARNSLNQDICAAILQRVYFNPCLKCVDINGNNLSTSDFVQQIVKPYFRQRDDFTIIVD